MKFAENCPKSCPPDDVEEVTGEVFRFVRNDPPTSEDMKTYADEGKPGSDACGACALSVLRSLEDVELARKAMPWFKRRLVARALLLGAHGVIKQTGPHKHHYSYWVEATYAASIHEQFTVIRP
ncbi:hypothetical protein [Polyangium spumosum]|uniref:Uncharacterized protein n=1 Tax=Polyangium spumosum TaxID=889282 RepID=A0A6N7Q1F2_9BACT|nr:hypothetical protein [Polyangium spumosum]MRG97537.1 hypothetical protein [Polyangium spumosum]